MPYFYTQAEYDRYLYKRDLRKTSNSLGIMLSVFVGLELFISVLLTVVMQFSGILSLESLDMNMLLLENNVVSVCVFFVYGFICCIVKGVSFSELFPFHKIKGGFLLSLIIVGFTLSLLSNFVSELFVSFLGMFGVNTSPNIDVSITDYHFGSILIYFVSVAVVPALVEEFAFRGIVMGRLRKYGDALALVVSSAVFGLMHGNIIQIPFAFCGGLVFGFLALKSGSLLPGVIVHFLNNATSVALDVLTSSGALSDDVVNLIWYILLSVLTVAAIFIVGKLVRKDPQFFTFSHSDDGIPYKQKVTTVVTSPAMIVFAAIMLIYTGANA